MSIYTLSVVENEDANNNTILNYIKSSNLGVAAADR